LPKVCQYRNGSAIDLRPYDLAVGIRGWRLVDLIVLRQQGI
jgi:hypothetical protein